MGWILRYLVTIVHFVAIVKIGLIVNIFVAFHMLHIENGLYILMKSCYIDIEIIVAVDAVLVVVVVEYFTYVFSCVSVVI